jgi:hypothetical protein
MLSDMTECNNNQYTPLLVYCYAIGPPPLACRLAGRLVDLVGFEGYGHWGPIWAKLTMTAA